MTDGGFSTQIPMNIRTRSLPSCVKHKKHSLAAADSAIELYDKVDITFSQSNIISRTLMKTEKVIHFTRIIMRVNSKTNVDEVGSSLNCLSKILDTFRYFNRKLMLVGLKFWMTSRQHS